MIDDWKGFRRKHLWLCLEGLSEITNIPRSCFSVLGSTGVPPEYESKALMLRQHSR
jgi:hypothetical protein